MKISSLLRSAWRPSRSAPAARGSRHERAVGLVIASILSAGTLGCGNTLYLVQVNRAERDFEEAERLGAQRHAPYEYYSAKARLAEARYQAAQAEYGPAAKLCTQADDYAVKAINLAKLKRREPQATQEEQK